MKVEFQPAYILHSRPFKDTSLILDCLTHDFGRVSVLAKGVRTAKSKLKQSCQPFSPLLISWLGRSDLKTLVGLEGNSPSAGLLQGDYLYSGFYLNELLVRVLPQADACPEVFERYTKALQQMSARMPLEPVLRQFELGLLNDLGYAVDLVFELDQRTPLSGQCHYAWVTEQGWMPVGADVVGSFFGDHLLAMGRGEWEDAQVRRAAKQLTRGLLKPLLGDKPLTSRQFFQIQSEGKGAL